MPWRIRYRRHYEEYSDFTAEKYNSPDYIKVGEGIYGHDGEFFCSLSFVQEPQYGEGDSASNIARYPLEDILDKYYAYVADFYTSLNRADSEICYLELGADCAGDICQLLEMVGKTCILSDSVREWKGVC